MASRKEDRFGPHELYLGIDVGKSFHWAVGVDAEGTVTIDRPLRNRQDEIDALLGEAGEGALVIVDPKATCPARPCSRRATCFPARPRPTA